MMRKLSALLALFTLLLAAPALAQDQAEEEKSRFTRFLEDQLSSQDMDVSISNIQGVLSSEATIGEIAISDREGVWLRIQNARIDWNRSALFLGRLEVETLAADVIEISRQPLPPEGLPEPEAGGFSLPDLPVAVIIENLSVPRVAFGEGVFGLQSIVSIDGSIRLDDGELDSELAIQRIDGPGGALQLNAEFGGEVLNLDLTLDEPANGILANLLNIEGRPPVTLTLQGEGPVANLDLNLALQASGNEVLSGTARLRRGDGGLRVNADVTGALATLVPEAFRDFFGGQTALQTALTVREGGGLSVETLTLQGGEIALEATAETAADGFLTQLDLNARIADPDGGRVVLPVAGGDTSVGSAVLSVAYGVSGSDQWSGTLRIEGYAGQDIRAETVALEMGGVAANLDDPQNRRVTFDVEGLLSGLDAERPDIANALGKEITLEVQGAWQAGQPVALETATLAGQSFELALAGEIAEFIFDGRIVLDAESLTPFSGLAGRQLAGSIELEANGTVNPLTGGFDLALDGAANGLQLSVPTLDALIDGAASLSGRVARDETGLSAENFRLASSEVVITADGTFSSTTADFSFEVSLEDLARITEQASGRLLVRGDANGTEGRIDISLVAEVPRGQLAGKTLSDAAVRFDGVLAEGNLTGNVSGDANLAGAAVELSANVAVLEDVRRVEDLVFETAGARIEGAITQQENGLFSGELRLDGRNIENAAALLLLDASGAVDATVRLTAAEEQQNASITAEARALRVNDIAIGTADIEAELADLFGVPKVDGTISAENAVIAGVQVASLSAVAQNEGAETAFRAEARLTNGTTAATAGRLVEIEGGYRITLSQLAAAQGQLSARLLQPAELQVRGQNVSLSEVRLDVAGGEVRIAGSVGNGYDVNVNISALPLSIGNLFRPDLGLSGSLNGQAVISGPRNDPRASFSISGSGLSAAPLREAGISSLSLSANGSYANGAVVLEAARLQSGEGLSFTASGRVPLSGGGLNLSLNGSAPLGLANVFLGERGARVEGVINISGSVTGSLANPQSNITASISGASFVDPQTNLQLQGIAAQARLEGSRLVITSASANLSGGGSVSASGSVALDPAAGFPADIAISLNEARYADGELIVATVSGRLQLTGPVTGAGLLSGTINVARAEIVVPELGGGAATLLDVYHRYPPADVARTLEKARVEELRRERAQGSTGALRLNVTVNAPNQIFIRGRGLDAELGGSTTLTGNIGDIQPVGAFELIRGRLSILGQRIVFDEGRVTLTGDLDPFVNLVASTQGEDVTVFITVSGRVSDLDVDFSSQPALPQDEVLARLIFNRGLSELSPLQIAQLAAAAAELAGGSNTSLLDSLRGATGFDDLDVITDDEGNAALRAGRYIQDNIYLGIETGVGGETEATINLDITEDLKARGSVGTEGETSIGIFYERDY